MVQHHRSSFNSHFSALKQTRKNTHLQLRLLMRKTFRFSRSISDAARLYSSTHHHGWLPDLSSCDRACVPPLLIMCVFCPPSAWFIAKTNPAVRSAVKSVSGFFYFFKFSRFIVMLRSGWKLTFSNHLRIHWSLESSSLLPIAIL